MRRAAGGGFTLLEMLVAVALLAVLSIMSWRGLDAVVHTRTRIAEQTEETRTLLRVLTQLERDMAALRSTGFNDTAQALTPGLAISASPQGPLLDITRGVTRPDGSTPLQRVRYGLDGGRLMRATGRPGFALPLAEPDGPVVLLERVQKWELRGWFTSPNAGAGQWVPLPWPANAQPGVRMTGLSIELEYANGERYIRVLAL